MKKTMRKSFKKMFAGGNPDQDNSGMDDPYKMKPLPGMASTSPVFGGTNIDPRGMSPDATATGETPSWGRRFAYNLGQTVDDIGRNAGPVASRVGSGILPYASNIANAFRTPPLPHTPTLINPVTLSKIDLSDARNRISRTVRGQNLNASRTLDAQSAAAVRNANLAKEIEGTSQVSEQEAFLNSRQRAEQAGMNLNVASMNARGMDQYNNSLTERSVAQQREQSQNMANASDKAIAMQNERAKANLDLKKIGVLSQMWKSSGVYDRMLNKMKKQGIADPTGILGQIDPSQADDQGLAYGGHIYAEGGTQPMAFGGFNPAAKPFPMTRGKATGENSINPFGNSRSIGLGGPNAHFNPKHITHSRVYQDGGGLGMDTPDNMMSNDNTYRMGGTMNYPVRPQGIRRMDFAGIEHMAMGGDIPLGAFQEEQVNRRRPTPGPDDMHVGMDIMADGGGIHIKKANRGKFTAYKARTGKTTAEALHSKDPHVRQMANFARNAKKWNH